MLSIEKLLNLILLALVAALACCSDSGMNNGGTPFEKLDTSIVIGTDSLVDPSTIYDGMLKANWCARTFKMCSSGRFRINIEFTYLSDNPNGMRYIGSVLLMMVWSCYLLEPWGDFSHNPLTNVIPAICQSDGPNSATVRYEGNFMLPDEEMSGYKTLYAFELPVSWIRVFADNDGMWSYQWIQGDKNVFSEGKLDLDQVHRDITGSFRVYQPLPETQTTLLYPASYEFDYVSWIKKNLPNSW